MIRTPALALMLVIAGAGTAAAQDGARGSWDFAVGGGTDNRSKDISKTDGEPFVYALTEWSAPGDLFYAGAGVETIRSAGSRVELDANFGVRPQVGGFDLDLNVAHKWRLDSDPGVDDDAWEFTASASRSIGPASGRLLVQHSPDGTGPVRAWTWVEGRAGWAFTDRLEGTVAVGRREQDGAPDYTGWNAGVTYALSRNVELDVRYHDNDADIPGEQYSSALVATVDFAF
jgi:opacity protein-like surface antigen